MINLAGVDGFEPPMPESESGALPLGDTPKNSNNKYCTQSRAVCQAGDLIIFSLILFFIFSRALSWVVPEDHRSNS